MSPLPIIKNTLEVFSKMKKINLIIIGLAIAILLSVTALSQIALSPISKVVTKNTEISPALSLEEKETCVTEFYEETEAVYDDCIYYRNTTNCLNTTGENTDCTDEKKLEARTCKMEDIVVQKNKTICKPNENYVITITDGKTVLKKQIDYSDWGPCIHEENNGCLVVTCVSNEDGAFKGQFTDCTGGKSCQKFEICDGNIKTYYKNSREDFVESDPSFFLPKLQIKEVEE